MTPRQNANNKRPEVIPNYFSYQLKVNSRTLTKEQARHFFECINIIHRENHKIIYRGDKKDRLLELYNLQTSQFPDQFNNAVFVIGTKGRMFLSSKLPEDEIINIAAVAHNEFALIFVMLHSLLNRELPFSARRSALVGFRDRENGFTTYFRNINNQVVVLFHVRGVWPSSFRSFATRFFISPETPVSKEIAGYDHAGGIFVEVK